MATSLHTGSNGWCASKKTLLTDLWVLFSALPNSLSLLVCIARICFYYWSCNRILIGSVNVDFILPINTCNRFTLNSRKKPKLTWVIKGIIFFSTCKFNNVLAKLLVNLLTSIYRQENGACILCTILNCLPWDMFTFFQIVDGLIE